MLSNFHVVIPARFASTRLPGKPLVDIAGLPMIVRVYRSATKAFSNADVLVATDDLKISEVLDSYSIPWVMTRLDHESGSDRIAEVCEALNWSDDDIVLNVQGDEPLIPVDMLTAFIGYCRSINDFQMATISAPIVLHDDIIDPNVVKVVCNNNGVANYFSRSAIPFVRDEVDIENWPLNTFRKHVGVYGYKVSTLKVISRSAVADIESFERLEQLRALWLGFNILVMPWTESPPHGVDTIEDAVRASNIIKEQD